MQKSFPFIKLHGAGNDFVFIMRKDLPVPLSKSLVKKVMDRHFGIGADQLMLLESFDVNGKNPLRIYNSDGSEAEMCGNGVRAVAYYLIQSKKIKKNFILTPKRGTIGIECENGKILVDMGEPILEGRKIPVNKSGPIMGHSLKMKNHTLSIHAVSMGNPHAVIFVENLERTPVQEWGPLIENHSFFPHRVNVEFVQVVSTSKVIARVWERGAGETLACGTGACAILVAGARAGKLSRKAQIQLPGGSLGVEWKSNNHVFLTGPTEVSFEGKFLLSGN